MRLVRLFTLFALLAFCSSPAVNAQSKLVRSHYPAAVKERCIDHYIPATGAAQAVNPINHEIPVSFRAGSEFPIGTTLYDLQSNGSVGDRMSRAADGRLMGVWTMALQTNAPDRGTGYNQLADGVWGDQPTARLESDRTGWGNHGITEDGTELTVAHTSGSATGDFILLVERREAGTDTWAESSIPSNIYPANGGPGLLWPRMAVSGNTVHVVAVTTPVANGGAIYEGIDGHPLYYRSTDGGATWDMVDVILPGMDNTTIAEFGGDVYSIDASGETVAIAFFDGWNDLSLLKSTDNGASWEKKIVLDFPLEKYAIDDGYTIDQLPPFVPDHPAVVNGENATLSDSLAIFTSDGSGSVLIDNEGMAHVFWGEMWVSDADITDGNSTFYPTTSGIGYWNESYETDSIRTIADVEDVNGNDTLDIVGDNVATYFLSMTTFPSSGVDASGYIYLFYSAVMETDRYLAIEDNQYYRHIYGMASLDGGETWLPPYDIINPDIAIEPDLVDFVEAVFPSLARDVAENVDLVYQGDFRPGMNWRGDGDPEEVNFIYHVTLEPELLGVVIGTEEVVRPDYFQLEVQPNPARNQALASFELGDNARYRLSLLNMMGQKVRDIETANGLRSNQVRVDVSSLTPGIYLLRLQAEDKVAVAKLVVR